MNVTIPKTLQKQVQKRAKKSGLSEAEYVRRALKETIAAEDDLAEEMELWELSSLQDFNRFAKKYGV